MVYNPALSYNGEIPAYPEHTEAARTASGHAGKSICPVCGFWVWTAEMIKNWDGKRVCEFCVDEKPIYRRVKTEGAKR